MSPLTFRLLLVLGAAAGYALLMGTNPIKGSLRDGWRCLSRYKQVWGILAFCGVVSALFLFAMRCYEWWSVPGARPAVTPWIGWRPVALGGVAQDSGGMTLLSVAAIFDCLVTLFPLSVLAAGLFLVNWRGYQRVLLRGVVKRFGWLGGACVHSALILCAVAAVAKPILLFCEAQLLASSHLNPHTLAIGGGVIYWLSFIFEYFLGVGLQVYLALLCFAWVRGMTFDFEALHRFAVRRFTFVLKWAAVVALLASLGLNLPVILDSYLAVRPSWLGGMVAASRVIIPVTLLIFCSMQLTLVFHNESLRRAFADHTRFLRRHGGSLGWLIIIAALHFFLLNLVNGIVAGAWGGATWPTLGWRLILYPSLWAVLGAWFLASWVCLFRRCESNRPDLDHLVEF